MLNKHLTYSKYQGLNNYVNIDRMIIKDIISKYGNSKILATMTIFTKYKLKIGILFMLAHCAWHLELPERRTDLMMKLLSPQHKRQVLNPGRLETLRKILLASKPILRTQQLWECLSPSRNRDYKGWAGRYSPFKSKWY